MTAFMTPKFWISTLLAVGLVGVLYVIFSAAVHTPMSDGGGLEVGPLADFSVADPRTPAPEAFFFNDKGAQVRIADFAGRVVLVNVWATWCAPCIEEMPALDRLQSQLGGDDFQVVAVSADREGIPFARSFLTDLGVESLDVYSDPKMGFSFAVGATGLPTTVIYDRAGQEVGRLYGAAEWDAPEAAAFLEDLIAAP